MKKYPVILSETERVEFRFHGGVGEQDELPESARRQECHLRVLGAFYNTRRLHSALGYRSQADSEEGRMGDAKVAYGKCTHAIRGIPNPVRSAV
jgi:hypothetical protein